MTRWWCGEAGALALAAAAALSLLAQCCAGPLGPLQNVTSSDLGLKEGSCALGDVVYMAGDEFPGASPCERCRCAGGGVSCQRQRCQPRPGCKALHRPDQCCPIYQCECEQEGRVYGNGEKLVDPRDPCRVCYCQGGEVVCRRIACFVRDDCSPRAVPGRCCPEYDNCPLRGVTGIPGVAPSSVSSEAATSSAPPPARKDVKQQITIKEITPVSEIPVITEVKIKEIIPSPSIDVAEYSSSKSPLIVREATSEKPVTDEASLYSEIPGPVEVHSSSVPALVSSQSSEVPVKSSQSNIEWKNINDSPPSKISLSTQDSINSDIYPSILTSVPTMGSPSVIPSVVTASATKAPVMEEEDPSFFEHNPAFPPLPDDLSVIGNHEDEIVVEQNADGEHISIVQEPATVASSSLPAEDVVIRGLLTTTFKEIYETTPSTTKRVSETSIDVKTDKFDSAISTKTTKLKESPMLNLRSAIPTEILNVPSFVPEEITGDMDDAVETTAAAEETSSILSSIVTEKVKVIEQKVTSKSDMTTEAINFEASSTVNAVETETATNKVSEGTVYSLSSQAPQEQTTNSISKSNIATEITSQTELSSLPIETSDQNPHETISKDTTSSSTVDPLVMELTTTKISSPVESEVITVSRAIPLSTNNDDESFENVETTEFILTSFGSSESATDAVELIKISAEPEKSAPFIEPGRKKSNVLTDLINLVGDVASISDHTESPPSPSHPATAAPSISDSEELIPVNAGYKSKNSNWNVNSITEIPEKSKAQVSGTKQKILEIEGDDTDSITDSPPPHDRVEPTTRRPFIDNVTDHGAPGNKTEQKDIEIITKSYVPTIHRRPTKVVMKKSNEKPLSSESTTESDVVSVSAELATETGIALSSESGPATPAQPAAWTASPPAPSAPTPQAPESQ